MRLPDHVTTSAGTDTHPLGGISGIAHHYDDDYYLAIDSPDPFHGANQAHLGGVVEMTIVLDHAENEGMRTVRPWMLTGERATHGQPIAREPSPVVGASPDIEGIALSPTGTVWVADELRTDVREFSTDGRLLRSIRLPEHFQPKYDNPASNTSFGNDAGMLVLRGLAGVSLSPDDRYLFTTLQSPLAQGGGL